MRQVAPNEVKRDTEDVLFESMGKATKAVSNPKFYGKFRAYLFINFAGIGLVFLLGGLFGGGGDVSLAVFGVVVAALCAGICWLLWKGVAKKTKPEERRLVFWGFVVTGILTLGMLLLICMIVFIPLAIKIAGGINNYSYGYVSSGTHQGEYVLMRRKLNGQYEDIYGNVYAG